jgi:hypothetical protein
VQRANGLGASKINYTQLTAAVQAYTENYEQSFIDNIPVFVRQAETRIYNSVQIPALRKNVTGTVSTNNQYLSAPSDFLAVYSMAVIDNTTQAYEYMLDKDVNFIRAAFPIKADTGIPQYYALFGPTTTNTDPAIITTELSFIVGPTPNAIYYVELHYYYYPESIVTAETTWLGDNFDPALFYGALREAYLFMKGEQDLIANVEAKYAEAMGQLKRLGDGLERQDAYRSGQVRVKIT